MLPHIVIMTEFQVTVTERKYRFAKRIIVLSVNKQSIHIFLDITVEPQIHILIRLTLMLTEEHWGLPAHLQLRMVKIFKS